MVEGIRNEQRGEQFSDKDASSSSSQPIIIPSTTTPPLPATNQTKNNPELPASPFLTTSDIIRHLNKALAETPGPPPSQLLHNGPDSLKGDHDLEEEEEDDNDDDEAEVNSARLDEHPKNGQSAWSQSSPLATSQAAPQFELQRRLPDGSTRRVTDSEQEAADLESKLQQVAAQISQLPPPLQWEWIQSQKAYGNQLFSAKHYAPAIDVYLTCVMMTKNLQTETIHKESGEPQQSSANLDSSDTEPPSESSESLYLPTDPVEYNLLFLQLMNNMAQSALHLSWYHEAIQFANLALEELQPPPQSVSVAAESVVPPELWFPLAKLYFKRAKAHRLRGHYRHAKRDLDLAEQYLVQQPKQQQPTAQQNSTGQQQQQEPIATSRSSTTVALQEITRERQLIVRHVTEGRNNHRRQRQGMQHLLGGGEIKRGDDRQNRKQAFVPTQTRTQTNQGLKTSTTPLYDDHGPSHETRQNRRGYSSLKAPTPTKQQTMSREHGTNTTETQMEEEDDSLRLSYWQWYMMVIGKLAEELLVWLGDEEFVERRRIQQQQQQEYADRCKQA